MKTSFRVIILALEERSKFDDRIGKPKGDLGKLIHTFLIMLLKAVNLGIPEGKPKEAVLQIAAYREASEKQEIYFVPEPVFEALWEFNRYLSESIKEGDRLSYEEGTNLLISQLKHDVIGKISEP